MRSKGIVAIRCAASSHRSTPAARRHRIPASPNAPRLVFCSKAELLLRDIGDREMGELQIADHEARQRPDRVPRVANPLPEKRQLVAEAAPVRIGDVAGEIPPLGFELTWMRGDRAETHSCQPGSAVLPICGTRSLRTSAKSNKQVSRFIPSRNASATTSRPARHAGRMPGDDATADNPHRRQARASPRETRVEWSSQKTRD